MKKLLLVMLLSGCAAVAEQPAVEAPVPVEEKQPKDEFVADDWGTAEVMQGMLLRYRGTFVSKSLPGFFLVCWKSVEHDGVWFDKNSPYCLTVPFDAVEQVESVGDIDSEEQSF